MFIKKFLLSLLILLNIMKISLSKLDIKKIKVISFDVTGTLLVHKEPIMKTYAEAALWAQLDNPPTELELKPAFKKAYYKHNTEMRCFGYHNNISPRKWWELVVSNTLEETGRKYNSIDFQRYFRRVYQHYGSLDGYEILDDAMNFIKWADSLKNKDGTKRFTFGVTTNTPYRTIETVLPMMGYHNYLSWFCCSNDIGEEKPHQLIFDKAYELAKFWSPNLKKDEILHIGDNLAADFCGSKRYGFQALFLDRSNNNKVTVYQDWLSNPDYPGKSEDDIKNNSVNDFEQIRNLLEKEL